MERSDSERSFIVSMPSRACTSFLPTKHYCEDVWQVDPCQCPLELVPHSTPFDIFRTFVHTLLTVPGTSVACHRGHSLGQKEPSPWPLVTSIRITKANPKAIVIPHFYSEQVSTATTLIMVCQCPLGLIPHFYSANESKLKKEQEAVSMPSRAYTSFLRRTEVSAQKSPKKMCQCPLGLIPHFYQQINEHFIKNLEVSMPSRAGSSFLHSIV